MKQYWELHCGNSLGNCFISHNHMELTVYLSPLNCSETVLNQFMTHSLNMCSNSATTCIYLHLTAAVFFTITVS